MYLPKKISSTAGVVTLAFTMVLTQGLSPVFADTGSSNTMKLLGEKTIAHGATYEVYSKNLGSQNITVHALEVDLKNPDIKVAPVFSPSGIGSKAKVTTMAAQNGAIAAINSSFFQMNNEGGTLGMLVKDGKLLSNQAKVPDWNTFALLNDGHAIFGQFGFTGKITALNKESFPIEGINKTEYFSPDAVASNYSGTIHIFTRDWGPMSRGLLPGYDDIVEMEVVNQRVSAIRENQGPKPIPENGYVLFANGSGADFLKTHFKVGDFVDVSDSYSPNTNAIQQAIGANYLLVDAGMPVPQFPDDPALTGRHSRSVLGINRDGTQMILAAVDKSEQNPGATLPQMADILLDLGAYEGVNLDGGGSTSLVIQKPGELKASRVDDPSWERPVADALAVFNIAPAGELDHLAISGPDQVFAGQETAFTFSGYDSNYHPVDPHDVTWQVPDGAATVAQNKITWNKAGKSEVIAKVGGNQTSHPVYVVGKEVIQSVEVTPDHFSLMPNGQQELHVTLHLTNGTTVALTPDQIKWSLDHNEIGSMDKNVFTASGGSGKAVLTADVFGVQANVNVEVGSVFKDIDGHWAKKNIEQMAQLGYAKGTADRVFSPDLSLTRADFIVFLSRILHWNIGDEEKNVVLKEKAPDYAVDVLKYAKMHEVLKGDQNGNLNPYKPISRVEAAAILARVIPSDNNQASVDLQQTYDDWKEIPEWGRNSVQILTSQNIFGGSNHKFYPQNDITRAEMITVLMRAFIKD